VKNKQEAARKEAQERIKKFEAIREKEIRKRDSTSYGIAYVVQLQVFVLTRLQFMFLSFKI